MDEVLETIRAAVAVDATPEAKAAGVQACRAVLTALEATPGLAIPAAPVPATPVAAIVGALRGMPPDQLLDLAIARLRAALPPDTQVAPVRPVAIPIVPLPTTRG